MSNPLTKKRTAIELIMICALLYVTLRVGEYLIQTYGLLGAVYALALTITIIIQSIRFVTTEEKTE